MAWLLIVISIGNLERQHLARTVDAAANLHVGDTENIVAATLGDPIAEYEQYPGWSFLAIGAHPRQWCYGTYLNLESVVITAPFVGINPLPINIRWLGYSDDDFVIDWDEDGRVQKLRTPAVVYQIDNRYDSILKLLYTLEAIRVQLKLQNKTSQAMLESNESATPKMHGRTGVVFKEPPKYWWIGKLERGPEPAKFLARAWTLGALTDPASTVESIPAITESGKSAFGLRVSGTIDPPMDLYFETNNDRLLRIDWRTDIHRFSEWQDRDGVKYPAKCIGYKKSTGKPWYFSEILELERLSELPEGLAK